MGGDTQLEPDGLLGRAVRLFREKEMPDGPSRELSRIVVAKLREADSESVALGSRLKEVIMTHRTRLFVVAATLVVALLAYFAWWPGAGGDGSAFAGVQAAVRNVRSVTFKMMEYAEGEPVRTTRVALSGWSPVRIDPFEGNRVHCDLERRVRFRVRRAQPDGNHG